MRYLITMVVVMTFVVVECFQNIFYDKDEYNLPIVTDLITGEGKKGMLVY